MLFTLVAGYFAFAQYDVLFLYVILSDSEESHRKSEKYMLRTLVQGIAAVATLPRNDNKIATPPYLSQFYVKSVF